ncbi:monosaccharide-P-dolichol utilization protein [Histoplasma capsulatum var. duboisii H88]|uniref:Monosaccharide-P-dolichol utilization protein n=2 Tax=Ajellomyces capsulatus TaxID=5037 RepID=F0U4R6_AJEC8|nr:monosaccharide-P-dolichol utilization protein [Histoplasma capsulatum var. duboisii H88]QSS52407.1 monosaccharide-P-dolichol utilization protein [Histoplasma capsulatum var. duboisii H88]
MGSLQQILEILQTNLLNPLQPYLKPITSALPEPVDDALLSLLGEHCHSTLIRSLDVTADPACLPLAVSKTLGVAIVTFSAIVKVPQILKLLSSRSSAGVSFTSYALETTSLLITLAYNARQKFPFSTYGESALIAAQDIVVGILVLLFSGQTAAAGAFVTAAASIVYALMFSGETFVDQATMAYLQAGAGILGIASKVPQILTVWQEGGTGQLSAFAVFNYLLGSMMRIFTTIQEVDDKLLLYGFVAGFGLNLALGLQMLYYWNGPATAPVNKPAGKGHQRIAEVQIPVAKSSGVSPSSSGKAPTTRRRG